MYKDLIKKHLNIELTESQVPGISITKKIQDETKKANDAALKDEAKKFEEYEDATAQEDTDSIEPKKNELSSDEETYHDEMEIMNGQEMIQYGNEPDKKFQERFEQGIEGHPNMGNSPDYANVVPKQQGFSGPDFGKELLKKVKDSVKRRAKAEKRTFSMGDDIEMDDTAISNTKYGFGENVRNNKKVISEDVMADKNYTHFAIHKSTGKIINAWNYEGYDAEELKLGKDEYFFNDLISDFDLPKKSDAKIITRKTLDKSGLNPEDINNWYRPTNENIKNNKSVIKENKMKRLRFKEPFNGRKNALKLIPEHYKVTNKVFEMTDGNETYKVRWENENPVILESKNQDRITEDMDRMKSLMGYNSRDTFGTLKGEERIIENSKMRSFMDKTKGLISEDEEGNRIIGLIKEMEDPNNGTTKTETEPGGEINSQAPEAKKDVKDGKGKDLSMDKAKEIDPASGLTEEEEEDETKVTIDGKAEVENEDGETEIEIKETEEVPTTSPVSKPAEEKTGSVK